MHLYFACLRNFKKYQVSVWSVAATSVGCAKTNRTHYVTMHGSCWTLHKIRHNELLCVWQRLSLASPYSSQAKSRKKAAPHTHLSVSASATGANEFFDFLKLTKQQQAKNKKYYVEWKYDIHCMIYNAVVMIYYYILWSGHGPYRFFSGSWLILHDWYT